MTDTSSTFDAFIESHLNLQVKISYSSHHDFLLRQGLHQCRRVLDVGTGNGSFVARLAQDHPEIHFVGIDKRKQCLESSQKLSQKNLEFHRLDMFARETSFDFSEFDGFLMRYFLLHVDSAQKILELFKQKAKDLSRFWIIDLDWSTFASVPPHPTFDRMTKLVKDFCAKVSVDSQGGQSILPLLQKIGFQNIIVERTPFSTQTIPRDELALYLRQEILCYSKMSGRGDHDPETKEILRFIDEDFKSGRVEISYGMVLVTYH